MCFWKFWISEIYGAFSAGRIHASEKSWTWWFWKPVCRNWSNICSSLIKWALLNYFKKKNCNLCFVKVIFQMVWYKNSSLYSHIFYNFANFTFLYAMLASIWYSTTFPPSDLCFFMFFLLCIYYTLYYCNVFNKYWLIMK